MNFDIISDTILKIFKLGKLPAFLAMLISWVFILLPINIIEYLLIDDMINEYRPIIGLTAIFSTTYFWGIVLFEYARKKIREKLDVYHIKKWLKKLSDDEKYTLVKYISKNNRSEVFAMSNGVVGGLVAKGILYRASDVSHSREYFSYNIQDIAFEYLRKNPKLLD